MELPNVETQRTGQNKYWVTIAVLAILSAAVFTLLGNFKAGGTNPPNPSLAANPEDTQYLDFAERVAIALNNINFANLSGQRQDVSSLLSDELVTSYQKYFYDPEFQRVVADRRIYVTFQKIQRSSIESRKGDQAAVRVTGFNTYKSDVSRTQKEVPFTLLLQIEKKPDHTLVCTKLKKL